jgi:trans-2,3-dihydro-3-hydroxyanthranilate isomerase
MESKNFYIVDVFAESKYTGNQLAVFTNAEDISSEEMQQIAKEINYSETTFIAPSQSVDGVYDVRIFTPLQELPFAGHPTLGTAFILQEKIIKRGINQIVLNLKVGQIPVTLDYANEAVECLWMKQQTPKFYSTFSQEDIAAVLGLEAKEIDGGFPIQEVSTGIPFVIVPLNNLSSLKSIKIDKEKYYKFIDKTLAKCILAFCSETECLDNHLHVRVFCDYLGIPEDPATGSANGCLAGYLVKYLYFGSDKINVRVEQGYEIGRPSLLLLRGETRDREIEVNVGGKVILVAKGEFF